MQNEHERVLQEVEAQLDQGDLHGALATLNRLSPFRFTGIYRVDPPTLRNVALYDRDNPSLKIGSDAPLLATYCSITAGGNEPFRSLDTMADPRLTEHEARETTLAYEGVPLTDEEGRAFGTLCNFDVTSRPDAEENTALLARIAPKVARVLSGPQAAP